jgi:hypothetical protein
MKQAYGSSNAETLFGVTDIPSDNHVRNLLDPINPDLLSSVFDNNYDILKANGHLDSYRVTFTPGEVPSLLLALDGLHYFSSGKLSCKNCTVKSKSKVKVANDDEEIEDKNEVEDKVEDKDNLSVTYSHSMVTPVIVAPNHSQVIPLMPEFVRPQDGSKKQDCELNASKRWIAGHTRYQQENITLLGDDLYAHEPFCKDALKNNYHFIFVAKPESHKTLYAAYDKAKESGEQREKVTISQAATQRSKKTIKTTYSYVNNLPLNSTKNSLRVNLVEITVTTTNIKTNLKINAKTKAETETTKQTYHNVFITDYLITDDNVELIAVSGRSRWKVENENNNTLKTKGYHLEHNFGHGKDNLASLLATLNIIAFSFHTMQELMNDKYALLREMIGPRKKFFVHMQILLIYACFDDFDDMLDWMIEGLKKKHRMGMT